MTTIYVAAYITADDYDTFTTSSELHDYSMGDFLNNLTCCAGTDRARVLARAREMLIAELMDAEDLNPTEARDLEGSGVLNAVAESAAYNKERRAAINAMRVELQHEHEDANLYNCFVGDLREAMIGIREFEEA